MLEVALPLARRSGTLLECAQVDPMAHVVQEHPDGAVESRRAGEAYEETPEPLVVFGRSRFEEQGRVGDVTCFHFRRGSAP